MIEKAKLVKVVGARNVSYDPATLDEYAKDMSFVNAIKPDYVVKPSVVNQRNGTLFRSHPGKRSCLGFQKRHIFG